MTKILLITTKTILSLRMKFVLQKHDCYVQRAKSLCEGWILLGQESFDLILLDSKVGEESGIDFCHSIRHRARKASLVLMGSDEDAELVLRGKLTGVSSLLKHPFTSSQLVRTLNRNLYTPLTMWPAESAGSWF